MSKKRCVVACLVLLTAMACEPGDAPDDMSGPDSEGASGAEDEPADGVMKHVGEPKECAFGQLKCDGKCYNPYKSKCFPGGLVCPIGYGGCWIRCYSPSRQKCFPGGIVCPLGYQVCGIKCYDPIHSACQ